MGGAVRLYKLIIVVSSRKSSCSLNEQFKNNSLLNTFQRHPNATWSFDTFHQHPKLGVGIHVLGKAEVLINTILTPVPQLQ